MWAFVAGTVETTINAQDSVQLGKFRRLRGGDKDAALGRYGELLDYLDDIADLWDRWAVGAGVTATPLPSSKESERELLIRQLAGINVKLMNTRDMCKTVSPAVFRAVATQFVEEGVKVLQDAGFLNEARRLADGKGSPTGRYPVIDCAPYRDENWAVATGINARIAAMDDIIVELRR